MDGGGRWDCIAHDNWMNMNNTSVCTVSHIKSVFALRNGSFAPPVNVLCVYIL